ncbi:MAG: 50S ribosomal protein L15 [candidate division WOR-3 bacterium]
MELSRLKPPRGSREKRKRVGRGPGSGMGTYSTRGIKGQNARSGRGPRLGFEGGQTPLTKRIPKRGFSKREEEKIAIVNLVTLSKIFKEGDEVTIDKLREEGLVGKREKVKILGKGEIDKKLIVHTNMISKSAKEKIEKLGGKVIINGS